MTPLRKLKALYLLPLADREEVMYNFSGHIPSSEKLDMLPVSSAPRLIPYKDELLSTPRSRGHWNWVYVGAYVAISVLTYYGMWVQSASWDMEDNLVSIVTTGVFQDHPEFTLKMTYTGFSAIDNYLAFLSAIFSPGLRGWDKRYKGVQIHLLSMLITPLAVWTIEAFRKRNSMTLIAL